MSEANQSAVILLRNPFQPSQREVMVAHPSQTIRQWLGTQGIAEFDQPTVCIKNGSPVLRADWAVTHIDGVVLFITLPQGGGGGGGGLRGPRVAGPAGSCAERQPQAGGDGGDAAAHHDAE